MFTNILCRGRRRDDEIAELRDDGLRELRLALDDARQHHAGQLHRPLVGVRLALRPATGLQQVEGQLHHAVTHLPSAPECQGGSGIKCVRSTQKCLTGGILGVR